ncbi:hypothetical protein HDK64DRAFT_46381 [Phyllosticta capitalensis]
MNALFSSICLSSLFILTATRLRRRSTALRRHDPTLRFGTSAQVPSHTFFSSARGSETEWKYLFVCLLPSFPEDYNRCVDITLGYRETLRNRSHQSALYHECSLSPPLLPMQQKEARTKCHMRTGTPASLAAACSNATNWQD